MILVKVNKCQLVQIAQQNTQNLSLFSSKHNQLKRKKK